MLQSGENCVYAVTYASRRSELWRWYWRAWARPRGLWRLHVLFALTFGIVLTGLRKQNSFEWGYFCTAAAVGFISCVAILPLWPQIRFKRATRTLTIATAGLRTTVGTISGSKSWKEVHSVEEIGGTIVITGNNKNAFIIPTRAFNNDSEHRDFYQAARRWHAEAIG